MELAELYARCAGSPKYRALADAIALGVTEGALPPGQALPTQRDLAAALGVTVGTVTRGYAEAARRGLILGVTGRGTFVASPRPDVDIWTEAPPKTVADAAGDAPSPLDLPDSARPSGPSSSPSVPRNLGFIAPFEHLNPSLTEALARLLRAGSPEPAGELAALQRYQRPAGMERHRAAGALWARRYGVAATADDILICAGSQHALLTILTSLCQPGDRIAAEILSYPLLKQLARRLRLNVVPVRSDESGMLPDALDSACRSGGVAAVYLMPSCRNPTLGVMPEGRRRELAEVCRRHDVLIIEDDVYALSLRPLPPASDARGDGRCAPALAALAPERTCFIAATSEILGGGLRVAYLCPPQHHGDELERTIAYTISMVPPLMAELAALWIEDGTADRVLRAKRDEAAVRNRLARDVLDGFSLETRTTGFFCWLRLPAPWTGAAFADAARRRGVLVAEGEHFAMGHDMPEQGVRLALGGLPRRADLAAALAALADVLRGPAPAR